MKIVKLSPNGIVKEVENLRKNQKNSIKNLEHQVDRIIRTVIAKGDSALVSLTKKFDNIKIDLNKLLIFQNKKEFKINNTEKIILEKMINSPGQTFTREEIGKLINLDKERSIDVIITRLRKKIENDPKKPKFLQTIRGTGYVLWIE